MLSDGRCIHIIHNAANSALHHKVKWMWQQPWLTLWQDISRSPVGVNASSAVFLCVCAPREVEAKWQKHHAIHQKVSSSYQELPPVIAQIPHPQRRSHCGVHSSREHRCCLPPLLLPPTKRARERQLSLPRVKEEHCFTVNDLRCVSLLMPQCQLQTHVVTQTYTSLFLLQSELILRFASSTL